MTNEEYDYIAQYRKTYESAAKKNYAHILPRSVNERLNQIIGGPEKKNWDVPLVASPYTGSSTRYYRTKKPPDNRNKGNYKKEWPKQERPRRINR